MKQFTGDYTKASIAHAFSEAGTLISSPQDANRDLDQKSQKMIQFLAEASNILGASLDYETTLHHVGHLIVPQLADWFSIDMIQEEGKLELLTLVHKNPEKVEWAKELRRQRPPDMQAPTGMPHVIRTGISELYEDITDEFLVAASKNEDELKLLRHIGFSSVMIVPLVARGRTLGGITFVTTKESNRHYDKTDLAFAEDLASRIGMAIDNATLMKNMQKEIQDRTNAEQDLQEAHKQTVSILESIADSFMTVDKQWHLTYLNSHAEKLIGKTNKELIGKTLWTQFPVGEDSAFYRNQMHALEEGSSVTFIDYFPQLHKWYEIRDYPSDDGLSIFFRDITHQKEIEEQVKEKETRSRQLFESNIVGIMISDIQGNIIEANEAFLHMTGFSLEDVKNGKLNQNEITPDWYKDQDDIKIRELKAYGIMTPWQKEYIREDGTLVPILIGGALMQDHEKVVAFVIDITEQKRAERDRERLLQEKTALLDSTGEGIFGVDLTGKCTFLNKSASRMLGFTQEEILGRNAHGTFHHHRLDGTIYPVSECPVANAYTHETSAYIDNDFILRKDGNAIPVEYTVSPVKVKNKTVGTVVSFNDITRRLEKENRKDEFLSIASHELKTPITTIKAFTQLLVRQFSMEETSEKNDKALLYLKKMDNQLNKLTNLVQDLLDVSRIQAGKLIYNEEIFNVVDLVNETITDMQPTTQKHELIHMSRGDIYIEADKYRINQVLTNLISNAIKYSPNASKIIIKSRATNDIVTISVQDFGIGIPKSQQTKIFERFYRVNDNKRESFPGLGIGLYISSEIVKRHKGRMWVESEDGKGSIFYLTLPRHAKIDIQS